MSEQANELLNMFIRDAFSSSGKIRKKTALEMMKYVASQPKLQSLINAGNDSEIINYKHQHKEQNK
tara:strand:+ start:38 stop:235 length:198 start_codon:yes stop_codon:yes gene_type:complete